MLSRASACVVLSDWVDTAPLVIWPTLWFLLIGLTALMSLPLCQIFIQVFKGRVLPSSYKRIRLASGLVSGTLLAVVIAVYIWDIQYTLSGLASDTPPATLFAHWEVVRTWYNTLVWIQVAHLALILIYMTYLSAASRRALKRQGRVGKAGSTKALRLSFVVGSYAFSRLVWVVLPSDLPRYIDSAVALVCNILETTSLVLLMYPSKASLTPTPTDTARVTV
ncbi:hypothetical protein KIPB_010676, partial [Kipferlia bialata]|eukprot:g10676.t1